MLGAFTLGQQCWLSSSGAGRGTIAKSPSRARTCKAAWEKREALFVTSLLEYTPWPVRLLFVWWIAAGCGDNVRIGAGPDTGDAGPGPDGGGPAAAPAWCDDHNACTDDRAEAGGCRFDPVTDGQPCDD